MTNLAVAAVSVDSAATVGHVGNNELGRTGICRFFDPDPSHLIPFASMIFSRRSRSPYRDCRADYEAGTRILSLQGVHRSLLTAS